MTYKIASNQGVPDENTFCKCGKKDGDYRASHYISEFLIYKRNSKFVCRECRKNQDMR